MTTRWIEDPASVGLRFAGLADQIANLRHTGWFVDDFQQEAARGVVYRLPARRGADRYLAGMLDPYNVDPGASGPALVDFDVYDDERSAASAADDIAKWFAEREREYQLAWRAGQVARDLSAKATEAAKEFVNAARALRKALRNRHTESGRMIARELVAYVRLRRDALCEATKRSRDARDEAPFGELFDAWRDGYGA